MKGKTRQEKGITLIALIITIVILLILAVIAINSIVNEDLIAHAGNSTQTYNNSVRNEQTILGGYEDFLDRNNWGTGGENIDATPVEPKVGQYVEYDVSYDDIYNSTSETTKTFGKTDGWRYLGTESGTGNHLLISTGIPMILYHNSSMDASWWDSTQTSTKTKVTEGLKKNLVSIPYENVSAGTQSTNTRNTMIGLFGNSNRRIVGNYFKENGKAYADSIHVRTLTIEELNRAVNIARDGEEGYISRTATEVSAGFKDIPAENIAYGLFDLADIGLENTYIYWLASPCSANSVGIQLVKSSHGSISYESSKGSYGIRPVIVLPASIQFTDVDDNKVLEIKDIEVTTVKPMVGQYVEYDVPYDDIFNSTSETTKAFGKTDGWRYLGTESGTGNHLLISTGIPMILNYDITADTNSSKWWDDTQTYKADKAAEGLKQNFESIPYVKVSSGTTSTKNKNTMIGLFGDNDRTTVGDYFKITGKSYSDSIKVRTLTIEELNEAVNIVGHIGGEWEDWYRYRKGKDKSEVFKDIPSVNVANGLFDLSDLGLLNNYNYWLASGDPIYRDYMNYVSYRNSQIVYFYGTYGIRPVIVLPSSVQFDDVDNNMVLEIKE